jgi:AefR-like transcriptional repressor, C-terminal domain
VFRLEISETVHAPKVAQALETVARKPTRDALRAIMANAKSAGLLLGDPEAMTEKFLGLLWGDLMTGLLLQVADRPSGAEIARRARGTTMAFLQIYPEPGSGQP